MKSRKDKLLFTRIIQNIIVGADAHIGPKYRHFPNRGIPTPVCALARNDRKFGKQQFSSKKRKIMLDIWGYLC